MSGLHLEPDFERWPEVRSLAALFPPDGGASIAALETVRLFVELVYQAPVTRRVGYLSDKLTRSLACLPQLVESGLLIPCPEGGFVCPRFESLHSHLRAGQESIQVKGKRHQSFSRARKVAEERSFQLSLGIDPKLWVDAAGAALAEDEIRKVTMLVLTFDAACNNGVRSARRQDQITASLIQDALRILRSNAEDLIHGVALAILDSVHPAMPRSTESALRDFEKLAVLPEVARRL